MQEVKQIGKVDWTYDELRQAIPDFLELYKKKPIFDNQGGMTSAHLFATWFMLKKLNPKNVIESGIWKGQGTWLIENTLPDAKIYSIDVNLSIRKYISDRVQYFDKDFFEIDWSIISDKENTVLFFDDHQNAFERIKKGTKLGFKHFIFEDNYPAKYGDCYSLKKVFQHAGFRSDTQKKNLLQTIKSIIKPIKPVIILPNSTDASFLKDVLAIYYEFPPVFKKPKTRWGDDWTEEHFPTPEPLFESAEHDYLKLFEDEAVFYTWICYALAK
jgi:hypothetical protein